MCESCGRYSLLTLTRAKLARGAAGEPLPTVFNTLGADTIHFRKGQFTLIAAAPGVGKSVFALTLALRWGVPGFYFSADTDAFTMYLRAGSLLTGWSTHDIENAVKAGNTQQVDTLLDQRSTLRMDFTGRIIPDDLEDELKAFAMTYGEWPSFIVVDNISNLDMGGEGYQALELSCDYLHELARYTGAAVIALHHVTGEYDDGTKPVPLPGLRGKISKVPELILTLYRSVDFTRLFVCPVKNRMGRSDSNGGWSIPFVYDPARAQVREVTQNEGTDGDYGYPNPFVG